MNNRYWIFALACASMFITVVDLTIVNVALPTMATHLHLGEDALQWVVIGYGLPFGGLMLLAGRLGDIRGRRPVLQSGLLLFTLGSLAAGLAQNSATVIAARAVQGVGAALIAPSALALVANAFPEGKQRENALGIYGALGGAAATVGVLTGGLLTDGPGWRWIFLVNVPIGLVLSAAGFVVLRGGRPANPGVGFDPRSAISVTGGLVLGLYALNRGVVQGWTHSTTLVAAAAAVALLITFALSERRTRNPLIPARMLRNRSLALANLAVLTGYGSFFAFIFISSLLMQQQLGYSATRTGVSWLVLTGTGFVFAGLTGAVLAERFGAIRLVSIASLLMVACSVWMMFVPAHAGFAGSLLPVLCLGGVAIGLFAPSSQIAALTDVTDTDFGVASGLVETSREFGGSVVIAGASTALLGSHTSLLSGLHAGYAVIAAAAALGVVVTAISLTTGRRRPRTTEAEPAPTSLLLEQFSE